MKRFLLSSIVVLMSLFFFSSPMRVFADTPGDSIVVWTAHPTVVLEKGHSITFSLEVANKTQTWQDVDLTIEGPTDWEPIFKKSGYAIRRLMIEPDKSQSFDLQLKQPADVRVGEYAFIVKAVNQAGVVAKELRLVVNVQEKATKGGLKFTTDYPDVRGQPGNSFSFRFDLANESDQDRVVNFEAITPKGWEIVFKPGYESRQISSLPLKGNATQTINADVTAPSQVEAGEYKFIVRAVSENERREVPLTITVVGKPSLSLGTASGQLNTRATVDSESKLTLVIKNTGSAPVQNISLSSFKPDGWEITFNPDKLNVIPVGESREVNVTLKPSSRVLAGDYMVSMTASGGGASDSKEIRVTVETPTTWGFAALGAIGIVVLGLALIFARFSRR